MVDVLKENVDPKLFKNSKEFSIGFNLFDTFANIKLFSSSLFDQ